MLELYINIKKERIKRGWTQSELAEKVGYADKSMISKIESGLISLDIEAINRFASAFGVYAGDLMGETRPSLPDNILPMPTMRKLPIIGSIACGTPILAEENVDGLADCPDNIRADFCLHCHGDSMIGARIMDGDVVYIRKQADVLDGQIAAVLIDDEATLKRVYKIGQERLELRPENPTFPIMTYSGEELERIRIIGLAVAFSSPVK